ncbi:MAG TPA: penicillin-binding protein 2, partial [Desulfobacteraceae bacterium]|nr:penicillin-binding protein 2 [Desulfobacteraceae bacterium]
MKFSDKKWIRFRVYLVSIFFLAGLAIILTRAFQLQVLETKRLYNRARNDYVGTTKLPPKRGTIYDREGHELALSVEVGSVYAHPKRIREKAAAAKQLAGVLKESRKEILERLSDERSFVWIKRRVSAEQAGEIESLDIEGVGIITETRRYYTGSEIAAHLIGFAGVDNQGLEGIEKRYDEVLTGPQYSLIHMRDAMGRLFSISSPIPSGHGARDIVLTIDKDIQYKAQQALRSAVEKNRAASGHCLVVDPATGEIIAMAVVPEFNPNTFSKFMPYHWRNRTVTDVYEPGSTIKAFLLAAGLEKGAITPDTVFDCEQGEYEISGHIVHDTRKYGMLSVSDIIAYSSNIGAIKIGEKTGHSTFCDFLLKFGFSDKTGIELPGERDGFIRMTEVAKPIDQTTLFFGQGMLTTSLQMVMAMAAIANGGNLMRPYVVKKIMDESGQVMEETRPRIIRRVISSKTAKKVSDILQGVISGGGTAPQAAIPGFTVAGKTGTSQKVDPKTKRYSNRNYVSTFVGFVPADNPRLVILIVIDEPRGSYYG